MRSRAFWRSKFWKFRLPAVGGPDPLSQCNTVHPNLLQQITHGPPLFQSKCVKFFHNYVIFIVYIILLYCSFMPFNFCLRFKTLILDNLNCLYEYLMVLYILHIIIASYWLVKFEYYYYYYLLFFYAI